MAIYRTKELEILNNIGVDIPIASVDTSHFVNKLKAECDFLKIIKFILSYQFFYYFQIIISIYCFATVFKLNTIYYKI